jgi:hypothetical protein
MSVMAQSGGSLSAADFIKLAPWQYRLPPADLAVPGAAPERGPDLPLLALEDRSGRRIGWLLGFVIDLRDASLPRERLLSGAWFDPADPDGFVIALREEIAGRFLIVIESDGLRLVYPDAGAQVPCVHDRETGWTGSTAGALLGEAAYEARFDRALFEALGVDGEGWFPAGLTAHHGLERLLPNHRLDLRTGEMRRFWPRAPIPVTEDPAAVVQAFAALMKTQLRALAGGDRRVALALTGGRETRVMLACAREILDQMDVVTIVGTDRHARDSIIARRITRSFGLRHLEVPRLSATPEERARFIRRGGHSTADSNSRFHPSVRPLIAAHVFAGGLWGEIGRAFFWRGDDHAGMTITPALLLGRFGLPDRSARLSAALEAWLRGLAGWTPRDILDLAYIEHRLGPWGSAQFCCDPTLVRHAPMLTQPSVALMLSLPPEWKESHRLGSEVVACEWPELAEIPYNSLGRIQDLWVKIQRALENPALIVKKLRKMRA